MYMHNLSVSGTTLNIRQAFWPAHVQKRVVVSASRGKKHLSKVYVYNMYVYIYIYK